MSKITAKHFLNTNLKPYIINGVKHYSIYILLIAYRQNTKVKSITFNEYYSEDFFNEIINSNDKEDINLIDNEINTITLIAEFLTDILGKFDTAFITSYFKFTSLININNFSYVSGQIKHINKYDFAFNIVEVIQIETEDYLGRKKHKTQEFNLLEHISNCLINITLYDFFNKENQTKLKNIIIEQYKGNNIDNFISDYNKAIIYNSLDEFSENISQTKNDYLLEKYQHIFDLAKEKSNLYYCKSTD